MRDLALSGLAAARCAALVFAAVEFASCGSSSGDGGDAPGSAVVPPFSSPGAAVNDLPAADTPEGPASTDPTGAPEAVQPIGLVGEGRRRRLLSLPLP